MTEEDTHMADTTTGDDTRVRPGREYPGTPRWVKVLGIVTLVLVLLAIIVMVAGGGNHGPGRHIPSGGADGLTSPSSVTAHGVQQP
jgi:hypothetical protein